MWNGEVEQGRIEHKFSFIEEVGNWLELQEFTNKSHLFTSKGQGLVKLISCKFLVKKAYNLKHSSARLTGFIPYNNIQNFYSVLNKRISCWPVFQLTPR